MKANLSKREFLQLSSVGGIAAAVGLLGGTDAEARTPLPEADLVDLAQSIASISYLASLAFVIGAIIKFHQQKMNPTESDHNSLELVAAVWSLMDDAIVAKLTRLGYDPQFVVDAVKNAEEGDTSELIDFLRDLKSLGARG